MNEKRILSEKKSSDMKLGIMQPYFLPYLGYFSLIKYVDKFIFFDSIQYIKHGWVNRNRILKQGGQPSYITVPVAKSARESFINKIVIAPEVKWQERLFAQLEFYKKKAPYYQQTVSFLHEIIDRNWQYLSELNIRTTEAICHFLGIERSFDVYSRMSLDIGEKVQAPDEWALEISKALGYDIYVNAPGGIEFFDRTKYEKNNVRLEFLKARLPRYVQRIGHYEPGLSIVDVMMFCNEKEINDMLDDYEIL